MGAIVKYLYKYESEYYLNLLILVKNKVVFFDGVELYLKNISEVSNTNEYSVLDYSYWGKSWGRSVSPVEYRKDAVGVIFIKLSNEDIFQISIGLVGSELRQTILIFHSNKMCFNNPNSVYQKVLQSFEAASPISLFG